MSEFKTKDLEDLEKALEEEEVEVPETEQTEQVEEEIDVETGEEEQAEQEVKEALANLPKGISDIILIQTGGNFITYDALHPVLREAFEKLLSGDVDEYNKTMQNILHSKELDISTKKKIFKQLTQFLLSPDSRPIAEKMIEYAKAGKPVFVPKLFFIVSKDGTLITPGGLIDLRDVAEKVFAHVQGYTNADVFNNDVALYLYTMAWLMSRDDGKTLIVAPSPSTSRIRTAKFKVPEIKVVTAKARRPRAPKGVKLPRAISEIINSYIKGQPTADVDSILETVWLAVKGYINLIRKKKKKPKIAELSDDELKALIRKYIRRELRKEQA